VNFVAPKVSVIIPMYNVAPYVAETLASVMAQTLQDFEILAVNDGSTDDTVAVAQRLKDQRLKILNKPNGGAASARNYALKAATGDYVAFLDGDDLWLPEKLALQVGYLDQHPGVMMLYGEALMFYEQNGERLIKDKIGFTADPTFRLLLYGDFIPNSTTMFRRACLAQVGLLNEALPVAEDYEFWMRFTWQFQFAALPQPLALYRLRAGSLLGDGADIEKGLRYSLAALRCIEGRFPEVWQSTRVDRARLFARLHIRAGFAFKQRGAYAHCLKMYLAALRECAHPIVWRWLVAATVLKRWS
jgi:glycosyltransferase involved in cell wall biosynthesis